MKFGIGQPVRRYEDLRLITGRGRYTDDIELAAIGAGLRSALADGARAIRRIDATAARKHAGRLLVPPARTCEADGLGDLLARRRSRAVMARRGTTRRVPCWRSSKVRHVGQPVALVVAETLTAGARCRRSDRGRLRGAAGGHRRQGRARAGRAAAFRPHSGQHRVRLGQRPRRPKATEAAFAKAAHVVSSI